MGTVRRCLLTALPKLALSRATRALASIPVPRRLRGAVYGTYARRYGANLDEMQGELAGFRTMAEFFQRPLVDTARPVAPGDAPVWPCDGKVVSCGPLRGDRIEQIKGQDYTVDELVGDAELARALHGGSQATVYLAPGDYHRVHSPFAGDIVSHRHVPGGLFPVNPGAVRSIPKLFVRNEREILESRLPDGRRAAVAMVAALNVGDTVITCRVPGAVDKGAEIGRFGLGSTVVALLAPGHPSFPHVPAETVVRCGAACVSAVPASGEPDA